MTVPHLLLALGTVMAWGLNYVAIGWGVRDVPPMLLAALRFTCAANGKGKGESFCNVCCKIHPGPADEAGGNKMTLGQE